MAFLTRLWWGFVRLFFWLLYGPLAWAYDAVAWVVSLGRWTAWGRTALDYVEGRPVLELAHGPGHLMTTMARRGLQPVGIDLSPHMGRLARQRLRRAALPERLVQARAQALPFRNQTFRAVVAAFPTEFILDSRTVRETKRVLALRGKVAVVAGTRLTSRDPLSRLLEWLYRVTGQREPLPREGESSWRDHGMEIRFERVCRGSDQILIGIAERREDREG